MKVEVVAGLADDAVDFVEAVQDPALEFRHGGHINPFVFPEGLKVSEQEPKGVPQPPVAVRLVVEDLARDAQILAVVGRHHPDSKDVGSVAVDHFLGEMTLPSDLDILRPLPSTTKPWVRTAS